jgi:hypothetical protein
MKQLEAELDKIYHKETIYKPAFSKPKNDLLWDFEMIVSDETPLEFEDGEDFLSGLGIYEMWEVKQSSRGFGESFQQWRKEIYGFKTVPKSSTSNGRASKVLSGILSGRLDDLKAIISQINLKRELRDQIREEALNKIEEGIQRQLFFLPDDNYFSRRTSCLVYRYYLHPSTPFSLDLSIRMW